MALFRVHGLDYLSIRVENSNLATHCKLWVYRPQLLLFSSCSLTDYGLITNVFVLCAIGKRMRGRLMEWVEKASFDRLDKLFVISTSEQHY